MINKNTAAAIIMIIIALMFSALAALDMFMLIRVGISSVTNIMLSGLESVGMVLDL